MTPDATVARGAARATTRATTRARKMQRATARITSATRKDARGRRTVTRASALDDASETHDVRGDRKRDRWVVVRRAVGEVRIRGEGV
jgi:hypothetical protein